MTPLNHGAVMVRCPPAAVAPMLAVNLHILATSLVLPIPHRTMR